MLKWMASNFCCSSSVTGAIRSLTPVTRIWPSGVTSLDTAMSCDLPASAELLLTNGNQVSHGLVDSSTEDS